MNNAREYKQIKVLIPEIVDTDSFALAQNENRSLSALIAQYLSERQTRGDISAKSLGTYQRSLNKFSLYLESRNITAPTEDDIFLYRQQLVEQGLKAATIGLYLTAARMFLKWAGRKFKNAELATAADDVKAPKIDRTQVKKGFLNAEQAGEVIENIDRTTLMGKRDYALVLLMVTTGLRTVEVARANIGDIQESAFGPVLYVQGKGHTEKDRFVKLTERTLAAIREYLDARGNANENEALFTSTSRNNTNGRMTTYAIFSIVKRSMRAVGLDRPNLTAHSLRHTAAILNMTNGGTLYETQQLLRHASPVTTEVYTHIVERMGNNSENRIEAAIFQSKRLRGGGLNIRKRSVIHLKRNTLRV